MKFRISIIGLFILLSFGLATPLAAQVSGGRKKEHRSQRSGKLSLFKKNKNRGNADAFANGGNKRGFFARIFKGKKDGGAWVYKRAETEDKKSRDQSKLFFRSRTKNKRYIDGILTQQSKRKSKEKRSDFSKKKY